jgi:DNA-binding transcriptional ArsR family regulator
MKDYCDEMEQLGKGIGNANRYRILQLLMKGPKTVGDIVAHVGLSQPHVSQALKVLKSAKLVEDERVGQEVFYSVNADHLSNLLKLLSTQVQNCPVKK